MKIHPLWYLCIFTRLSMVYIVKKYGNSKKYGHIIQIILMLMALGFLNKSIYGTNNEKQITKVFWHDSRIVHAIFFGLSVFLLYKNKTNLGSIILFIDLRVITIYP